MASYYVLRRANGDILTLDVNGTPHIAVWDSEEGVRRSKRANPELVVYVPAQIGDHSIGRKLARMSAKFFLVDSSDPDLTTGREISRDELFGQGLLGRAA